MNFWIVHLVMYITSPSTFFTFPMIILWLIFLHLSLSYSSLLANIIFLEIQFIKYKIITLIIFLIFLSTITSYLIKSGKIIKRRTAQQHFNSAPLWIWQVPNLFHLRITETLHSFPHFQNRWYIERLYDLLKGKKPI